MLWLYKSMTRLVYLTCYLWGKSRGDRGNQLWKGRLGFVTSDRPRRIWLHAASVGEVRVSGYLVDYLLKRSPSLTMHITTMTRAGFNIALKHYTSPNISLSFFPLDCPAALNRALDTVNPELVVIAETEIWPNFVTELHRRGIPIVLVNARMTPRAFRKYRWLRGQMRTMLNKYDRFFFKTDEDSRRYFELGLDSDKGEVVGDMKFDAPLPQRTKEHLTEIRRNLGVSDDAFLFVAGSTRPGEEAVITNIYRELVNEMKDLVVVIAPRHVERSAEIKALLEDRNEKYALYGSNTDGERLILVDRLGVLNDLYLAADLAFVGGTLVDIGGHNILEPVWAGCPVFFGPSLFNVKEAADYIIKNNFGAIVKSEEELLSLLIKLRSGDIIYATKHKRDQATSPTGTIGEYILRKLRDA